MACFGQRDMNLHEVGSVQAEALRAIAQLSMPPSELYFLPGPTMKIPSHQCREAADPCPQLTQERNRPSVTEIGDHLLSLQN